MASKATGYPIAKITTKIALGYTLDEIRNDITGKTCACFEPALDYVVVKFPKWPFDKFADSSRTLGTQMKATGEVMAIAPGFEMALMKAVRGAEIGLDSLNRPADDGAQLRERLERVDDHRLFTVFEALKAGVSVDEIHEITLIDRWFLHKLKNLAEFERSIAGGNLTAEVYEEGKRLGYPDETLLRLSETAHLPRSSMQAVYKMVDTCAAEFDAETPYFYSSYDRFCESRTFPRSGKPVILVLGSGPIRIGQGIEFDYSSVHCVWTLKKLGYEVVIVNNNPETVSTDLRIYMEVILQGKIENPVLVDQYLMGKELEVDVISDGKDVLIPGVMQHIERSGVHSGDSIAVYPPFSIGDKMLKTIVDCSEKLTLALGTKGLVNIQYLIYHGELYVIELNPRASRTVPYISKVTGVPMVDLATRVMVGQPLASLGYGTGLYRRPPYTAVKVPVFSFEKLADANAALSPEMKSTGEVLGVGTNLNEALFKGLISAGFRVEKHSRGQEEQAAADLAGICQATHGGVLLSVNRRDQPEIVGIARKLDELGFHLYATDGTAREIALLGTDVEIVGKLSRDGHVFSLLESDHLRGHGEPPLRRLL